MHAMPTMVVVGSPNSSPDSTALGSASLQQRRFSRKASTNLSIEKNPAVPIWSINKTNTSSSNLSYILLQEY
jgi:hypothetical protein